MSMLDDVFARAKAKQGRVAFPEATEEKILQVAREVKDQGLGVPVLVGDPVAIADAAAELSVDIDDIEVVNAFDENALASLIERYCAIHPENTEKTMRRKAKDPMFVALMMEAVGDVDLCFSGISHTTGEVAMGGMMVLGLAEGITTLCGIGVFDVPGFEGSEGQLVAFSDSGICVDPTPEDLASIAICACDTMSSLLGWEPRCAMLSFSTMGSNEHKKVDAVREAILIAHEKRPDLDIDGEFQLDAALVPAIAAKKVPRESSVAGRANIIIWPDLNAGNIGVKLVQLFANANAYPVGVAGLSKIVGDCSRGAPVSEIVGGVAMGLVRACN